MTSPVNNAVTAVKNFTEGMVGGGGKENTEFDSVTVAEYLIVRLHQLGIREVFSVPGDFNIKSDTGDINNTGLLDFLEDSQLVHLVGNANELNAAYAADGYARVKRGLAAVCTTFGVGELSALNGIAGSFSEHLPVIHIVGSPARSAQQAGALVHHTLGDGHFETFERMSAHISIASARLVDANAASEIDRVLLKAARLARPGYISVPTDMVNMKVASESLKIPLDVHQATVSDDTAEHIVSMIAELVKAAKRPVILLDACSIRHYVTEEVAHLAALTGFPVFVAPMGKSAFNEHSDRFGGTYVGDLSHPDVKSYVESSDILISVGMLLSDFNSGNFSYHIPKSSTVALHSDRIEVQHAQYQGVGMKQILPLLTKRLAAITSLAETVRAMPSLPKVRNEPDLSTSTREDVVSQEYFWPRVGQWFKPRDVIIAETGTSSFGMMDVQLPADATFVSQVLWGSIGYSVGATLGCALAAREMGLGRTILFVGDGSLQLTVQEISTMMKENLHPIIFVLNNKGYTIEKAIHGPHRKYNDIAPWDHQKLLEALGGRVGETRSHYIRNAKDLNHLLDDPNFSTATPSMIQLVEVMMDPLDAPRALEGQAKLTAGY